MKVEVYESYARHAVRDGVSPDYCGDVLEGSAYTDEDGYPAFIIVTPEGFMDGVGVHCLRTVAHT